jgi:antirestriction protein
MDTIRIYITNLAKYNAGSLVGKWVDLPIDDEELDEEIKEVLGTDEELFITDYESPFEIREYDNPHKLNELAEKISELDEYDQEKVFFLLDQGIYSDLDDCLDNYEDVEYYPDMTLVEVAQVFVDDGLFGDVNEKLSSYIDYEALGRDLGIDGYVETDKGVFRAL